MKDKFIDLQTRKLMIGSIDRRKFMMSVLATRSDGSSRAEPSQSCRGGHSKEWRLVQNGDRAWLNH